MSAARKAPVHMAVAFLAMGGWSVFANRGHPMPAPLIAGLVQGTVSALITLFLKGLVDRTAGWLPGRMALFGPPVLAWAASAALLFAIHRAAGTPEVLATIAVPNAVATLYATLYSLAVWRDRKGQG